MHRVAGAGAGVGGGEGFGQEVVVAVGAVEGGVWLSWGFAEVVADGRGVKVTVVVGAGACADAAIGEVLGWVGAGEAKGAGEAGMTWTS